MQNEGATEPANLRDHRANRESTLNSAALQLEDDLTAMRRRSPAQWQLPSVENLGAGSATTPMEIPQADERSNNRDLQPADRYQRPWRRRDPRT